MRGLAEIIRMNERQAAGALKRRYERLRNRAIARGDGARAKRYDGYAIDFARYLKGEISVFPGPRQHRARLFVPSVGRDFALATGKIDYPPEFAERVIRLDPSNRLLRRCLVLGRPLDWWFVSPSGSLAVLMGDYWLRRQFEELLGYYRLLRREDDGPSQ